MSRFFSVAISPFWQAMILGSLGSGKMLSVGVGVVPKSATVDACDRRRSLLCDILAVFKGVEVPVYYVAAVMASLETSLRDSTFKTVS